MADGNGLKGVALLTLGAILGLLLLVSLIPGFGAWYTVQDGERAVETQFGAIEDSDIGPGLHFKLPIVDGVTKYNVRAQEYTMSQTANEGSVSGDDAIKTLTNEGLNIRVSMTVRYNIQQDQTGYLYENIGKSNDEVVKTIVRPTVRTAIRDTSSKYSVESIYADNRTQFSDDVKDRVRTELEGKGLNVQAIQIRNIMLPDNVRKAIQEKQATQERIQTKENKLEIAELEKQRKVIEAQGIAESNKIIGASLSQEYLDWYFIQEGLEKGDAMYVIRDRPGANINSSSSTGNVSDIGPELVKDIDSVGDENTTAAP